MRTTSCRSTSRVSSSAPPRPLSKVPRFGNCRASTAASSSPRAWIGSFRSRAAKSPATGGPASGVHDPRGQHHAAIAPVGQQRRDDLPPPRVDPAAVGAEQGLQVVEDQQHAPLRQEIAEPGQEGVEPGVLGRDQRHQRERRLEALVAELGLERRGEGGQRAGDLGALGRGLVPDEAGEPLEVLVLVGQLDRAGRLARARHAVKQHAGPAAPAPGPAGLRHHADPADEVLGLRREPGQPADGRHVELVPGRFGHVERQVGRPTPEQDRRGHAERRLARDRLGQASCRPGSDPGPVRAPPGTASRPARWRTRRRPGSAWPARRSRVHQPRRRT